MPDTHSGSSNAARHFESTGEEDVNSSSTPSQRPVPPILRLPPELFSHFLDHVPPALLQRTALALSRVFPDARVAGEYLWRYVTVRRGEQMMPLWMAAKRRRERVVDAERERRRRRLQGTASHGEIHSDLFREWESGTDRGLSGDQSNSADVAAARRLAVKGVIVESWRGDADILNNALRCLPLIPMLILNMGTNFAPEHLAEMFETPRPDLRHLEMRFRPYVEQATYYQFLKGSYFDTAIEMLTHKWPESPSLTKISIVQDLPPRTKAPAPVPVLGASATTTAAPSAAASTVASTAASSASSPSAVPTALRDDIASLRLDGDVDSGEEASTPATSVSDSNSPIVDSRGYTGHGPFPLLSEKLAWTRPKSFAQPIVFFDIRCITRFGASPSARHLTHLRLRVPSRDVVSVLVGPAPRTLFPSLRYLDISTTNVRLDATLTALLKQFERLEHLVMDRVNLFGFQAKDRGVEMCKALGGMVPSACLARGKEKERAIVAWDVSERQRQALAQAEAAARAASAGRTGLGSSSSSGAGAGGGGGGETALEQATRQAREAAAEERDRQLNLARSRRGHRSAAMSSFSMRDSTARRSSLSVSTALSARMSAAGVTLPPVDRAYFVLPPLPTLRTLCIGGEARLTPLQVRAWTAEFHSGWRESLSKIHGWAGHVGERYERAKRKADEWAIQELKAQSPSASAGAGKDKGGSKGKGKSGPTAAAHHPSSRPPMDVRLYRYPLLDETRPSPLSAQDETHPPALTGLIEIHPIGRDYLDPYKQAMADAEMYANDNSYPAPCVLCTVPDCEGPQRRGDEGGRVDGRGGMEGVHVPGCGHLLGKSIWGWEGVR